MADEVTLEDNEAGGEPVMDKQIDEDSDTLLLEDNDSLPEDDEDGALLLEENACDDDEEEDTLQLEDNDASPAKPDANRDTVVELKERGNLAFKGGRLDEACAAYTAALAASSRCDGENAEISSTLLTNRAACCLKLGDWAATINDCTAALSMSAALAETRTKALFRRATAFLENGDVEGARRDLDQLPSADAKVQQLRLRLAKLSTERSTARSADPAAGDDGMGNPASGACGGGAMDACAGGGDARHRRWRVSCISPTTPERHLFHESALYRCFNAQTHADIELIVVDTGPVKSPFFTSPAFNDERVTYLWQKPHQTIGEKRNLAIQHASGDIICHFDDDDLYAPEYVATMVRAMEAEGADFVKLSAWLVHDLQSDATGLFDGDSGMPHPSLVPLRNQFIYTYGFSFLYRRALFPIFSFADTSWGEDQDILSRVMAAGKKLALHRDLTGICLHNQHGENCSRSFAQVVVSRKLLEASPLGPMLDALPIIGRALAKRGHTGDGGAYESDGQTVVIKSEVAGGLFVWSDQLERHRGNADATVAAFTHWLWSGNGFSQERYEKLGLQRPKPPESFLKQKAAEQQQEAIEGTTYGLESLRAFEGMKQPHALGAITNPSAYRDPAKKSGQGAAVPSRTPVFAAAGSFSNPTRKFTP